ncbi:MAG: tRNA uracil 4-sulfurtransferase ThiI [Oscillospiraceae bacterium]
MGELILASMGELALKGLNRKSFESTLLKTLRRRVAALGSWRIHAAQSVIYLEPLDAAAQAAVPTAYERCLRTFGISALSRAAVCPKDFAKICETAVRTLDADLRRAKTFKVVAKRADKTFPMNSMEIGTELGAVLLQHYPHLQVDVRGPEVRVTVEVRERAAYVHGGKHKGAGGLPVLTSGRAALLLSGGIDSPVAAWLMAKRGLALVPIHFASPPYTSPRAEAKVMDLARQLAQWAGPLPCHIVPYTATQEYLRDALPRQDHFTVLMRRSMLRIAAILCEKEHCEGIVTGESLAQVASQTLQALACTDSAQALPILRPCIGMDKTEITAIAHHIGTYATSIQPFEDCCTIFTPPHPKTRPKLDEVLRLESALPRLAELEAAAAEAARFQLVMDDA